MVSHLLPPGLSSLNDRKERPDPQLPIEPTAPRSARSGASSDGAATLRAQSGPLPPQRAPTGEARRDHGPLPAGLGVAGCYERDFNMAI
jgi:hypothetical protein